MNAKSKKPQSYGDGHKAWGRIFWGFIALILLSVVVTFLRTHFG
jgi:hypothetical protein